MKWTVYSVLAIVMAIMHLFAYWSYYEIDPFPILGPEQILTHALGVIAGMALVLAVGFALIAISESLKPKGKKSKGEDDFKFRWSKQWVIVVPITLIAVFGFIYNEHPMILFGIIGLVGIYGSFQFAGSTALSFLHIDIKTRQIIIFAFYILPGLSYFSGHYLAEQKVSDSMKEEVTWVANSVYKELLGKIYIGHLGDYEIFLSVDKINTYIVPSSSIKGFSVKNKNRENTNSIQNSSIGHQQTKKSITKNQVIVNGENALTKLQEAKVAKKTSELPILINEKKFETQEELDEFLKIRSESNKENTMTYEEFVRSQKELRKEENKSLLQR